MTMRFCKGCGYVLRRNDKATMWVTTDTANEVCGDLEVQHIPTAIHYVSVTMVVNGHTPEEAEALITDALDNACGEYFDPNTIVAIYVDGIQSFDA